MRKLWRRNDAEVGAKAQGAEGACRFVLHANGPHQADPSGGGQDYMELTKRLGDDCDQVRCVMTLRNERVHVRASVLEDELTDNDEVKELGKVVRKVQTSMFQDENDHEEMGRNYKIRAELNGRIKKVRERMCRESDRGE